MIISNQSISGDDSSSNTRLRQQVLIRGKRRKTKMPKMTVLAAYGGIFVFIVSVIAVGYQSPQPTGLQSVANAIQSPAATPDSIDKPSVDELVATDVAANLAEQTNMSVATNVANLSVSLAAKTELAQTSDTAIVKPQIVQPTASSRDISSYVTKQGDTVQSIAASYNISPDTIRWANNLLSDSLTAGKTLSVPPVDGVVYTVKSGDTPDSLAGVYAASKDRIVSYNDLEISGLTPGNKIVIPGGTLPENQRPGYQAPTSRPTAVASTANYAGGTGYRVSSGISTVSAGNKYAWGNCTWYAYERRTQMGKPVGSYWGNAKTWAFYARSDGYVVNRTPTVGAVLVDSAGYFGHVAVVESVAPNGDIVISEMNNYAYGGFGVVDRRTISAGQAGAYTYIQ
ncbi:MAG: putative domain containing protein [Candidatus Saccharibacteria bacterium]|nr:putative domain containing protein [Candidatus Saccharibacteria bacterium]